MKKNKKNPWKTASILLAFICLVLIIFNQFINNEYTITEDFKINRIILDKISSNFEIGVPFQLCDIQNNKCITMIKLK